MPEETAGRAQPPIEGEILVVDQVESVLRGLERLFRESGLTVTAISSTEKARDQISNRFFSVALIDMDTPRPDAGLDLVRLAKRVSPSTFVIAMVGRATFDGAAAAFRAGANDVVAKTREAVGYLRDRALTAAAELEAVTNQDGILADVAEVHDQFLNEMMGLARRVLDLEDRVLSGEPERAGLTDGTGPIDVLVVDDDATVPEALTKAVGPEQGFRVRVAQSGGEALDAASQGRLQVLVVKQALPDLPGTMVVKSLKASNPDVVVLLYTPPNGSQVGEVQLVEGSRLLPLIPSFSGVEQLVGSLREVREGLRRKAKERRYLQAFKKDHFDFLQKYQQVRQRLGDRKK